MSKVKFLGLGMGLGVLIFSVGFATFLVFIIRFPSSQVPIPSLYPSTDILKPFLTSTQEQFPTSTFTYTPTAVVVPTNTIDVPPSPSETPDAVQTTINNGGLIFTGALSDSQQIALYKSSLNYIQPTAKGSIRLSKAINGVGYGDPSNICGPLAIAIMHDGCLLINSQVVPHDFWLLNPLDSMDQRIIERAFPSERFLHINFPGPLNKTDWNKFPLLPGDFLFIWHGSWGNFDHMLVVTRVDSNLNTYSVTNFGTPEGFIIAETMLYNPSDPKMGIFHTWTKERDAILGSTGFGGFDLWRPLYP